MMDAQHRMVFSSCRENNPSPPAAELPHPRDPAHTTVGEGLAPPAGRTAEDVDPYKEKSPPHPVGTGVLDCPRRLFHFPSYFLLLLVDFCLARVYNIYKIGRQSGGTP